MVPHLLYVGDVPVEASYHGSALVYRLLSDYPHEQLMIIETATQSEPRRRLPGVEYLSYPIGKPRWLNTRFHPYAVAWYSEAGRQMGRRIAKSINGFECGSVLTVAHGFGWLAAASIAKRRKIPLHLVVHDDWPRVANVAPSFRKWLDAQFAAVYRQARSRMCVSPAMGRDYEQRYGAPAEVLYPSRARDCPDFAEPPARLGRNDGPFTIAFAGTINSDGYVQALRALQDALEMVGGRLVVFGPQRIENTDFRGLADADQLIMRLREEADALFVPMSFEPADRANMELAFPSKLADYTATGLPLLIYGPPYCSAVAWARENEGVAEVVESEADLKNAVDRLANDPAHRVALGQRALDTGRKYFSHAQVQQTFIRVLSA
ncbi:MAG TPA: glycosyltransferase [Pyrinomonadaceae bacterium]|nr:glycosyltransferase [Pyrinomonadaceae bacterium]